MIEVGFRFFKLVLCEGKLLHGHSVIGPAAQQMSARPHMLFILLPKGTQCLFDALDGVGVLAEGLIGISLADEALRDMERIARSQRCDMCAHMSLQRLFVMFLEMIGSSNKIIDACVEDGPD